MPWIAINGPWCNLYVGLMCFKTLIEWEEDFRKEESYG